MQISALMVSPPITVAPHTSAGETAQQLADHAVGCAVVTREEAVLGIVTDRDLVVRVMASGRDPATPVSEVMSTPVTTLDVTDDVGTAYDTFRRTGARRLPVLDGDRLVGLVSVDDLFLDVLQRFADLLGPISWSALREPPATLAEPRHSSARGQT